ncbi:MAG: hypothetical protein M1495_24695 [Bacteroidetes bacterium]|nr:hypothetical protein [Bacteroidota bacterium]
MKYVITIILTFVLSMNAQTNISRVSIDLGIIRNYQYDFGNDKLYAFYPEVKICGQFLTNYSEWEFFTSYWTDGIVKVFNVRDAATYSYSSVVVGSKLYFSPSKILEEFPLPIYLTSGISYHKVNEKYIGGSDYIGDHRNDNSFQLLTFDIGVGIYFNIIEKLRLRFDTNVFIPFKGEDRLYNYGRNGVLKVGFDYIFNNK